MLPLILGWALLLPQSSLKPSAVIDQKVDLNSTLAEIRSDGSTPKLNLAEIKGDKPLVLFFFSEQCGVTFFYKDRIRRLQRDFEPLGFRFIGVRGGKRESPDQPLTVAETNYLNMKFVDDADGALVKQFAVGQSVTFEVIDSAGFLRYRGAFDNNVTEKRVTQTYLRSAMQALIAGKPVAVKSGRSLGCAIIPIQP